MSKTYPGNIKLAREHLRLAAECRDRAMELDPSLRARLQQKPALALDEADIKRLVSREMRKELTMTRSTRRRHAFDEGGPKLSDLREAHSSLKEACDSLGEMIDKKKFPFSQARDHCKAAMDHAETLHGLLGGTEGEDEEEGGLLDDDEREKASREAADGEEDGPRSMTSGGGRSADVGMSRAESAVNLKGVRDGGDHRNDFKSIKQGGADSAHGFDVHSLFQTDPDDFAPRRSKPPVRKTRAATQAHDTAGDLDSYYSIESLFQRDR